MKFINAITSDPIQQMTLISESGVPVVLTLRFVQNQQGWFYSLESEVFTAYNKRLIAGPNLLRQHRNIIDFGIAVITDDKLEPVMVDDFVSGRASLFWLNSDDVSYAESVISNYEN